MNRSWLFAAFFVALSCGDPMIDRPDAGAMGDAQTFSTGPAVPTLDTLPARLPYPVLTVRGRAPEARRVIIEGAGNPVATEVLPDGSFCADLLVDTVGRYDVSVFAQDVAGDLSRAPAAFVVEFDPRAPSARGLETCAGADPAGCPSTSEICDNGRDDDCDNLIDARDPACFTCEDDVLEPNDDRRAPRIDPGRYVLRSCPEDHDWFGVFLRSGEILSARTFFAHVDGNLDIALESPGGRVIARSTSLDDDEMVTHTATITGEYELVVSGAGERGSAYTLDLAVTRP